MSWDHLLGVAGWGGTGHCGDRTQEVFTLGVFQFRTDRSPSSPLSMALCKPCLDRNSHTPSSFINIVACTCHLIKQGEGIGKDRTDKASSDEEGTWRTLAGLQAMS